MSKSLRDTNLIVVSSGFAEGPSQALVDFAVEHRARSVMSVAHPLVSEGPRHHEVRRFERGTLLDVRRFAAPHRPPFTYPIDLVRPLRYPRSDLWFGFNGLAVLRGLAHRSVGHVDKVISWHVDFVPERFGNRALTAVYDTVDKTACLRSDLRVELSQEAQLGRNQRHGITASASAPVRIVPMGAWLGRVPKASSESWAKKRVVFLGHLVPRQGVLPLIDALAALSQQGIDFEADIVGGGPLEADVRAAVDTARLGERVRVHGFVEHFHDVERLLAQCSIAVAPYAEDPASFTRYADPGKLKSYLAAGLPIVLTPVPPNAEALADAGAAHLVSDDPSSLAEGIRVFLTDPQRWHKAHQSAVDVAHDFDWEHLIGSMLEGLGVSVER